MKSFKLFSGTAVLLIFALCSCRANDEHIIITPVSAQEQIGNNAFDLEPDPPKDDPKDYDDWKMKLKK